MQTSDENDTHADFIGIKEGRGGKNGISHLHIRSTYIFTHPQVLFGTSAKEVMFLPASVSCFVGL